MNAISKWTVAAVLLSAPMLDSIACADTVAYDTITCSSVSCSGFWFGFNLPLFRSSARLKSYAAMN